MNMVEGTFQRHGVQAAREMMRAQGMPMPPDKDREWLYEIMAGVGVSREEADALLDEPSDGREDH